MMGGNYEQQMAIPCPPSWLSTPPELLVSGGGQYCRALADILNGAVIEDGMLDKGLKSPDWWTRSFPPEPFARVKNVIISMRCEDANSLAVWRYRRIWWTLGNNARARWIFVATDQAQKSVIQNAPLGGDATEPRKSQRWAQSFRVVTRTESIASLFRAIEVLRPVSSNDWRDFCAQNAEHRVILNLCQILGGAKTVTDAVIEAVEAAKAGVALLAWESYFPPPPSHQHSQGNAIRKWLAVAERDTQWLKNGKNIIATIQL